MRCLISVTVALLGLPVSTQAQAVAPASAAVPASIGPNDVVARLLSFDRNRDGKVETFELLERMRGLVLSGDADGDGALNRAEIGRMANGPHVGRESFGLRTGPYRFGDEDGQSSSRAHITGALEDLRLDSATKGQALLAVDAFFEARDAALRARLVTEMESVLTAEQLPDFTASIDQPGLLASLLTLLTPPKLQTRGSCPGAGIFCNPTAPLFTSPATASGTAGGSKAPFRLPLEETLAALRRVQRPGDVERSELLEQLTGILSDEERDNFRAALERRPLVAPPLFIDVTAR
jgi:hypothetical protein